MRSPARHGPAFFAKRTATMTTEFLTNHKDTYLAEGDTDVVYGLDGNDVIDTNVEDVSYTLYGGDGRDALRGYNGADFLFGGRGADFLVAWGANDYLSGGPGHDQFWFAYSSGSMLDAAIGNHTIADFVVGEDLLGFDRSDFSGLGQTGTLAEKKFFVGAHAHDGSDRIIYNDEKGKLLYDSNGNKAGGEIVIAKLATHLDLTHNDILVGNSGVPFEPLP
jgi:serralysin